MVVPVETPLMETTDRDEGPASLVIPPLPEATVRDTLAFDEPESEPGYRRPPGIRDNMEQAALGRVDAEAVEKEARAIHAFIERNKAAIGANGYVEVRRVGPSELPPSERGKLGRIRMSELKGRNLADVVFEKYGGGEYQFVTKDSRNVPVPGGDFDEEIAGNIRPMSAQGEAWLDRQMQRSTGATRAAEDLKGDIADLKEEMRKPKDGLGGGGLTEVLSLMLTNMERSAQREREERLDRERKDREDREAREKRDREDREQRMEEDRERRQAEREAREKKEKEEREEREERQRRRDKRDEEEANDRREQFQARMKAMEQETQLRLKAMEMNAGGGLGIDTLKRVREALVDATIDSVEAAATGGESKSWVDVVKDVASKDGGAIVTKFLDVIGTRGAAQAPTTPPARQLAGPAGMEPPDEEPDVDIGDGDGPDIEGGVPAASDSNAALGEQGKIAAAKAAGRVVAFARIVGSELMAQGDPEAAWEEPQDERETTLADMYAVLALPLRVALRKGWVAFTALVPESAKADCDGILAIAKKHDSAARWLRAFIASAPPIAGMPEQEPPPAPKPFVPPQEAAPDVAKGPDAAGPPAPIKGPTTAKPPRLDEGGGGL